MRLKIDLKPFVAMLILTLTGCPPKKPQVVSPPPPPVEPPVVEKTFGEITYGGLGTLRIQYKSIVVLTDPGVASGELKRPLDYLVLTDGRSAALEVRKDLKIVASDQTARAMAQHGFTQAKGLARGKKLLLKKDEDFLFISAVGPEGSGYLLEFDNGRNIFVSGSETKEAVMREFVYGLRDDGKQIDLAFFSSRVGVEWCGVFIGLFQPQAAYILQSDGLDVAPLDESRLKTKLQEEMYSGQIQIPKPGDKIYF